MSLLRPASKLTVIIDGDQMCDHRRPYKEVLNILARSDMAGIPAHEGVESFGRSRILHSVINEVTSSGLPMIVEAVDTPPKIRCISAEIAEMPENSGLIQVQPTFVRGRTGDLLNKESLSGDTQSRY